MRVWTYGLAVKTVLGHDKVVAIETRGQDSYHRCVHRGSVVYLYIPLSILSFALESDTPQTYEINLLTC